MNPNPPIRLLINTPSGLLPLNAERARILLPHDSDSEGPFLAYGPYLDALSGFLAKDSFAPLTTAIAMRTKRNVLPEELREVRIISIKHGALYHVALIQAQLAEENISFAANVAVRPEQKAFLENEFRVLEELYNRYGYPFLPRPYIKGEAVCAGEERNRQFLTLFLAEWFEGYHEFHLSVRDKGSTPAIKIWDGEKGDRFLDAGETGSLYSGASGILSSCFDPHSFRQIFPWHHAAGDFVVRIAQDGVDVRLVTARGYSSLVTPAANSSDLWIGIVHFFLNLTIRMRLDRLDGTGELVWANAECLSGVIAGFLRAWKDKAAASEDIPSAEDMLDLLRGFTADEWLPLADFIMESGLVESDEPQFIRPRLEQHIEELVMTLHKAVF